MVRQHGGRREVYLGDMMKKISKEAELSEQFTLTIPKHKTACQHGRHPKTGLTSNFGGILHHSARVRKKKTFKILCLAIYVLKITTN